MKAQTKSAFFKPKYDQDKAKLQEFLLRFEDINMPVDSIHGQFKYMAQLQKIANGKSKILEILVEDLQEYFHDDYELIENILGNTVTYQRLLMEVAEKVKPAKIVNQPQQEDELDQFEEILNQQRMMNLENLETNKNQELPLELKRKYDVYVVRGVNTKQEIQSIRSLRSTQIGQLVTIRAIVVRVTDVRPLITVACYSCDTCGFELYQTISGKIFAPLVDCTSQRCLNNRTRGKLIFNNGASTFVPYQEIKVQELTEQLPQGSVPRAFTVQAKGDNTTRQCSPGDILTIQGVYLPTQKEGFMANRNLIFSTHLEAFKIFREKKRYNELIISEELRKKIEYERNNLSFEELYLRISQSIAPEIYGMEDVKKALLLMLIGGTTKEMKDGMKIRGDINVALIGDPGVAKSQLLRQVVSVSPRGIYTTGKGSSSVGLTAAIIKDEITGELSLEGGALVMADMGICCIDEFDKMNDHDRTAIHEVMEQQSVSIAKAGITTTLNARTSILAAANPLYGRYNKKLSPHKNINLPAALLSRFDLIFILLDQPNQIQDELLARHIGYVHKHSQAPKSDFNPYDQNFIRAYISMAKQFEPTVNEQLHEFISSRYVEKRQEQKNNYQEGYSYTTPRTLLAIIRLSQSLAKLRFSHVVVQEDVDEALRLMEYSQISVYEAMDDNTEKKPKIDALSQIFAIIKDMCEKSAQSTIKKSALEKRVMSKGLKMDDLEKCIRYYVNLNIMMTNEQGNTITLVN